MDVQKWLPCKLRSEVMLEATCFDSETFDMRVSDVTPGHFLPFNQHRVTAVALLAHVICFVTPGHSISNLFSFFLLTRSHSFSMAATEEKI